MKMKIRYDHQCELGVNLALHFGGGPGSRPRSGLWRLGTSWSKRSESWPEAVRTTSTDAELDAFEAERGVRLPDSYREFAKTFGRCLLGQHQYHA